MDYNARFYDSYLNRWTQPDTITQGGPQGLNRYSYVQNNPINATDPTGHDCTYVEHSGHMVPAQCQADDPSLSLYSAAEIQSDYGIKLTGSYTHNEAQVVSESLNHMEFGLDAITGGYGKDWMEKHLDGAEIHVGDTLLGDLLPEHNITIGSTVYLVSGFENYDWESPDQRQDTDIIHELGHVVDDRSSPHGMGDLTGGGAGDALLSFVGGRAKSVLRFLPNTLSIPPENAFSHGNSWDYGNSAPAEYFAQTFAGTIYSPYNQHLPIAASAWMSAYLYSTR
jgi:hypothetical protein